ncbi:MAG: aminotransferase class I/II-fold pyridoxal phosphate-dependent enzyme [Solirubrobacterales bacterium]|nr:aminotransferase class I/II-fold pyridoxal phosphate-dependent enzyme [Solirubrobacterales bacterium]
MKRPLDRYRQFEALTEEEVNVGKRAAAAERRAKELARVEPLDLARTTWPEVPPAVIVNAITYVARRGLHRYTDRDSSALRGELAARHGIPPSRIVVGDGAAALLAAATQSLVDEPTDELITPWPSYGLYPLMARRARAHPVPVPGFSVEAILSAVTPRTRLVALCNPNDPTGELLRTDELRTLLDALPERVVVLIDEALREYAMTESADDTIALLNDHPRALLFRSFSKAWGLAGLRVGYAIGAEGAQPLLERLTPELGVDELAQAGAIEALRSHPTMPRERAVQLAPLRTRLRDGLRDLGYDVTASEANVLWVTHEHLAGVQLAGTLQRLGIVVAGGAPLGDATRVRMTVPHRADLVERTLRAAELARG